ncbi:MULTISPECIES: hypothetical protein [Streptomyces]|uniref:Lipoprotein n=1 Tax=Streptomyces fradiae ATCC 10745 = DSM 40063 TaxID=1319510 RepID=A0ABQ6XNS7_STRFR|nr:MULTISPECIES: hypothetical protein [Streptomyces]KAF0647422.1 hypothetical protein K701_23590 [Streptomyces fradiae ATCC 10745 = DSM 40063]QEV12447.1 hypothetical protein CP974_10880 [Streptomyces fradiae ATCC 10745 = DSM 40063]
MPLQRTFDGRFLSRVGKWATFVALACLLGSSCGTSGEEEGLASDLLCDVSVGSPAGDAVRKTLGHSEVETTIFAVPSRLVQRMEDGLREWTAEEGALPTDVCLFQRHAAEGDRSVRISFQWISRSESRKRDLRDATDYVVNGVPAQVNEIRSEVTFPCFMPGDNRMKSRQLHLVGRAAFTAEGPGESREAMDVRHVTLAYLMAQKAVKALGCENEPLQGEPVVQPGKR